MSLLIFMMKTKHSLKTAFSGLRTNRSRSVLTILGIVIGVTAIMLVMSLGAGAQDVILGQIQGMGSKTIVVVPGRHPSGPSDFTNVFLDSLKSSDLSSIENKVNVPGVESVMPVVFGTAKLSYRNETYQATVLGGGNGKDDRIMEKIFDIEVGEGAFFNAAAVKAGERLAVLGDKVRRELFGENGRPVGERFKIGGKDFRVVGALPKKGQVSFFNFDEMVLVPYTAAQNYILGRKYFDRIIMSAVSESEIAPTVEDLKRLLRANHRITDPEKDDFFVETQADLALRLKTVMMAFTAFLASVAGISLLVGGVGIMNIMLVSVTERTREIGLRKALGATGHDILTQFLLEAVALTGAGGIIGILLGSILSFGASLAISRFVGLDWQFTFPFLAAVLGLLVSGVVGLVFGLYPARKASRMNPIDALRYE